MFPLLPIVLAATNVVLPHLPPELWSIILRNLDGKSLLAAIRTNPFWVEICRYDPVLRKAVREAVKEEKATNRKILTDARVTTEITRSGGSGEMFGRNVSKNVRIDWAARRNAMQMARQPDEAVNSLVKESRVGPIRRTKKARSQPYPKPMRF